MGLDMYLEARKNYYSASWDKEETEDSKICDEIRKIIPEMFKSGNLNYIEIKFEAGYWYKANQIHHWFVKNVQDGVDECQHSYVSKEKLRELLCTCKEVLGQKDKARDQIPPQSGFFFGCTDIDEYYFGDLEDTVKIIEKALQLPKGWSFYYHSSW